jgi:hypothetical protein
MSARLKGEQAPEILDIFPTRKKSKARQPKSNTSKDNEESEEEEEEESEEGEGENMEVEVVRASPSLNGEKTSTGPSNGDAEEEEEEEEEEEDVQQIPPIARIDRRKLLELHGNLVLKTHTLSVEELLFLRDKVYKLIYSHRYNKDKTQLLEVRFDSFFFAMISHFLRLEIRTGIGKVHSKI